MKIDDAMKREINEEMEKIQAPSSLYEFIKHIKEESELKGEVEKTEGRKSEWQISRLDTEKKRKLKKRTLVSIIVAAILILSFATSIRVSPVIAKTVASIPGMERIVALIQNNRGLMAAVENDFYQPVNLSQTKNGVTVTLDGVILDKKSIYIFYNINSNGNSNSIGLKDYQVRKGPTAIGSRIIFHNPFPISFNQENIYSTVVDFDNLNGKVPDSFVVGLQVDEKVEYFKIPFTFEKEIAESKVIKVDKEVSIEGQKIKVKELVMEPIRSVIRFETDFYNTKQLVSRAFDELKVVDENGDTWNALPGNSFKTGMNSWEVHFEETLYFSNSKELTLTFGKIAAIDKDEAYLLIDTETEKFLKQPKESVFSNLQIEDGKVRFTIDNNKDYGSIYFHLFTDFDGKEFQIRYHHTPSIGRANYVNGSVIKTSDDNEILEFDLPWQSYTNPIRFELDAYPSWIEEDVKIKIK